jgi:hypothetical protein
MTSIMILSSVSPRVYLPERLAEENTVCNFEAHKQQEDEPFDE